MVGSKVVRELGRFEPLTRAATQLNLQRNAGKTHRRLEIGPGPEPIPGFESLSIAPNLGVDYVWDAARRLPFPSDTFELVYASHVLEHVPWFQTENALREWVRVIQSGGHLEVWVPDAVKICEAFVDFEKTGVDRTHLDGWYRFNPQRDPCRWAAGRLFTYGDGSGRPDDPNWHRAMFSERYLRAQLEGAGLVDLELLDRSEVRGHDHGWINLGMRGRKP